MVPAANTNVDALSSFTACISAIPLRLNVGFIDIYELFSGEIVKAKKSTTSMQTSGNEVLISEIAREKK